MDFLLAVCGPFSYDTCPISSVFLENYSYLSVYYRYIEFIYLYTFSLSLYDDETLIDILEHYMLVKM